MTSGYPKLTTPEFVHKILDEFDARTESFPEYELSGALNKAGRSHDDMSSSERCGYWAEVAAFRFGPEILGRPDVKKLDADVLAYWRARSTNAKNPILRACYADLVWDYTKPVTKERPDVTFARLAIDSYLEASRLPPGELMVVQIRRLERGLELAICIGDQTRIEAVRDGMLEFFERHVLPRGCGAWGFLFDNLYDNKKVPLADAQLATIIDAHERLLARYSNPDDKANLSPSGAKAVALRLAEHYRTIGRSDDVKRVIRTYGNACIALSRDVGGLMAMSWLHQLYQDYVLFGMKDETEPLLLVLKEKGEAGEKEMKRTSTSITIPTDQLDAFVDQMTSGTLEESCHRIAGYFLPTESEAKDTLDRMMKEHPLLGLIGVKRIGEQQIIAEVGSIENDLDGRIVMQMSELIGLRTPFLAAALEKMRERYGPSAEDLLTNLYQSPVFDDDQRALLDGGLAAYFEGDHVKAIHVLVPQIEHTLRRLLAMLRRPTNKHVRSNLGVLQEKSLDDILSEPTIQQTLGDDVWRYLSVLLVDRRGYNLRNRLAHGLMRPKEFNRTVSDRVFHVLLVLSMIREREPGQDE